jgi:hypothetical protein
MKERTAPRILRFKISVIKKTNEIAAREGRTFAAQVRIMVEKQLIKQRS